MPAKLNVFEQSQVVANVLVQSYWTVNEDHIKGWIIDWLDSHQEGDFPAFNEFAEEFSFDPGYPNPSLSVALNELLQFIDLGGFNVMDKVTSGFENAYEALLNEIMTEREEQRLESFEYHREYREVAV